MSGGVTQKLFHVALHLRGHDPQVHEAYTWHITRDALILIVPERNALNGRGQLVFPIHNVEWFRAHELAPAVEAN